MNYDYGTDQYDIKFMVTGYRDDGGELQRQREKWEVLNL